MFVFWSIGIYIYTHTYVTVYVVYFVAIAYSIGICILPIGINSYIYIVNYIALVYP